MHNFILDLRNLKLTLTNFNDWIGRRKRPSLPASNWIMKLTLSFSYKNQLVVATPLKKYDSKWVHHFPKFFVKKSNKKIFETTTNQTFFVSQEARHNKARSQDSLASRDVFGDSRAFLQLWEAFGFTAVTAKTKHSSWDEKKVGKRSSSSEFSSFWKGYDMLVKRSWYSYLSCPAKKTLWQWISVKVFMGSLHKIHRLFTHRCKVVGCPNCLHIFAVVLLGSWRETINMEFGMIKNTVPTKKRGQWRKQKTMMIT